MIQHDRQETGGQSRWHSHFAGRAVLYAKLLIHRNTLLPQQIFDALLESLNVIEFAVDHPFRKLSERSKGRRFAKDLFANEFVLLDRFIYAHLQSAEHDSDKPPGRCPDNQVED